MTPDPTRPEHPRVQIGTTPTRRSGGWGMRALIPVVLVAVPLAEVLTLVLVGRWIGVLATVVVVLATSLLGLFLVLREGTKAWRSLMAALREGRMPSRELLDGSLVVLGALLLLVPGLLSDVLGLVLLIPPTRGLVRRVIGASMERQVSRGRERSGVIPGETAPDSDDDDPDGDVVVGRLLP
ncbi:MAG: FxsA family protein [Propionibacterium sp.]|nr:FxsA family protein [Propionibacterium sp.]